MKRYRHLTQEQRTLIQEHWQAKKSKRAIARLMGISPSTVSREIHRNWAGLGYEAITAQRKADLRRALLPNRLKKLEGRLLKIVKFLICRRDWSPDQISGWLKRFDLHISHEAIYLHVYKDAKKGGNLYLKLRRHRKKRRPRIYKNQSRLRIPNRKDIATRPAEAVLIKEPGHLQIDTVFVRGDDPYVIVTVVDCYTKTLYALAQKGKQADITAQTLIKILTKMPIIPKTMLADNGLEFAMHQTIETITGVPTYFATPYSSWQRGLNEHTNGLLRQYLPKKLNNTSNITTPLSDAVFRLNNRPRKILNYQTPSEFLRNSLSKHPSQSVALAA
jgi:transposase, IS30 family